MLVQFRYEVLQRHIRRRIVVTAGHVPGTGDQLVHTRTGRLHGLATARAELLVGHRGARHPYQGDLWRQRPVGREATEGREQFSCGQVA